MKQDTMKIKVVFILALIILSFGCENQENEFGDFTEQNVYFPIQYPVRTISLQEDSRIDNSIDLERAFSIGVAIGGVRENTKDRRVSIALAPELLEDAYLTYDANNPSNNVLVQELPSNYYSLESTEIIIPSGQFSGTIKVQLTDAFFEDPLALSLNYVIPLVITEADDDVGILTGELASGFEGVSDRRNPDHWQTGATPKDFTLFGVKYINKYHGIYLHKGLDETLDAEGGNVVSSDEYNTPFIIDNLLTACSTTTLNSVEVDRLARNTGAQFKMNLDIDDNNNVTISSVMDGHNVSGTGTFVSRDSNDAEAWGGESRKTFFLDYEYDVDGTFHRVQDTLVFRNDNLSFEDFTITLPDE